MSFETLYKEIIDKTLGGDTPTQKDFPGADEKQIQCLIHPEKNPPVWQVKRCDCSGSGKCTAACLFDAISRDKDGNITVDAEKCAGCSACIEACESGVLTSSRDVLPVLDSLKNSKEPCYALVAPAFIGQFSDDVTPGKLRTAFKQLGFEGMVEVALFADILTLRESLEFDRHVNEPGDFQLTSCCCPMWIAMIRRIYHELIPHVPGAVSPMIAAGRTVKYLHPDSVTVFIGPCIAKKAEARELDLKGAVDHVLTFREAEDIFKAAGINPADLPETDRDHSSRAGRLYARSGGVSEAVTRAVERISPGRAVSVSCEAASGVPECKAMIERIKNGGTNANFFEGMGCRGGCVGGPKALLDEKSGRDNVERYAESAQYTTPADNPYVIDILSRLGFGSIEDFLENSVIFNRDIK